MSKTTPGITTLFESIGEGFALLDHGLHYVYVNPAAEQLLQRTLAELEGRHVWEVFPVTPERAPFQEAVNRAHTSGLPTEIQALNMARGVWYDVRTYPYADGVAVLFRDVSEQKAAEARLADSEARFRAMADAAPAMIWATDSEGRCTYLNRSWAAFTGVPVEVQLGNGWIESVHVEDRELCRSTFDAAFERREPYVLESRLRRHDGEPQWVLDHAVPRFGPTGEFIGFVGIVVEVHERHVETARQRYLSEASRVLSSSLNYEATLRSVARMAVPEIADWCSVLLMDEDGQFERTAVAHADPAKIELVRQIDERYPSDPHASTGAGEVVRTGVPIVLPGIPDEMLVALAKNEEHLALIREIGMRSAIVVPMRAPSRIVGAITFVIAEGTHRFSEADLPFAEELAARAALAVENARLYDKATRAEEQARLALDVTGLGTWSWEASTGLLTADPRARAALGLADDEASLPIEAFNDRVHPDDLPQLQAATAASFDPSGTGKFDQEYRARMPDNTYRWVRSSAQAFFEGEGPARRPVRAVATLFDVTEQREAADALRESEERARLALEAAGVGVWTFDHDAETFSFDARARQAYGFGSQPVTMAQFFERLHQDDLPGIGATIGEALSPVGRGHYTVEYRVVHDDGSVHHLDVRARIIFDEEEGERRAVRSYGTVADVTASRVAAAELQEAKEGLESRVARRTAELAEVNRALEYRNRELQDFAYVASHDLQEPLRKIQSFAGMLSASSGVSLDEEGRHMVDRMQAAAERMSHLIRDLLAFSRVSTQEVSAQDVDLGARLQGVVGDLEVRLRETGGRVETEGVLPTLKADPVQMHQLLLNLVGNALKFHRPGVPPVVQVRGRRTPEGAVELVVADNGIGFEEKHADRIFSPFHRLHTRQAYEGTGMGLAIVRRIVERHGGTITAESTSGEGSRFTVVLPAPSAT